MKMLKLNQFDHCYYFKNFLVEENFNQSVTLLIQDLETSTTICPSNQLLFSMSPSQNEAT